MLAGWRLAINNLNARLGRSLLLIIAVALATSMVVTVSIMIGTINASMRVAMVDMLGKSEMCLRHSTQGRFPMPLADTVAAWPETDLVAPRLTANIEVINPQNGEQDIFTGQGVVFDSEWQIRPPKILTGRLPKNETEILIDPSVARILDVKVGDRLQIESWGRNVEVTVSGIQSRLRLAILQTPEIRLDLELLQHLTNYEGYLTTLDITLHSGYKVRNTVDKYKHEIPDSLELVPSDLMLSGLDNQLRAGFLMYYLAVIFCFLAASFIILTGMTTAVTERIRELAILRCIGAKRAQIFISQMLTGCLIGGLGGVLGIPIGIGLGMLIYHLYSENVRVDIQISGYGILTAILVSLFSGIAGSLIPGYAASRVTPLEALSIRAQPPRTSGLVYLFVIGVCAMLIQFGLLYIPENEQIAFWLYITIGLPIMIIGWFLLSVPVLWLVTTILAHPLSYMLRLPSGILSGAVKATPYRHGFTTGALMLGLAAMIATWSSGQALLYDWIDRIQFPEMFVQSWTGLSEKDLQFLQQQPWVVQANPITYFKVPVADRHMFGVKGIAPQNVHFVGFEPEPFLKMTNIEWIQGEPKEAVARLIKGGAIIVAREFLTARGIGVGDTLTLGPDDNKHDFEVVGVVSSPGLDIITSVFGIQGAFHEQAIHCVFTTRAEAKRCFDNDNIVLIQFSLTDNITDEEAEKIIKQNLGPVHFGSGRRVKEYIFNIASAMMKLASLAAFAAMAVASLGMANVMAANIAVRYYEYGVLRASGATQNLIWRLIMSEAVLIAITAGIIGMGLGLNDAVNATHLYKIMIGVIATIKFPIVPVIYGCSGLIILAMLAAVIPTYRLVRSSPSRLLSEI